MTSERIGNIFCIQNNHPYAAAEAYASIKVHGEILPDVLSITTMTVNSAEWKTFNEHDDPSRENMARASHRALDESLKVAKETLARAEKIPRSENSWFTPGSAFALNPTLDELKSCARRIPVDNSAAASYFIIGAITEQGEDGTTFNFHCKGDGGSSKQLCSVTDIVEVLQIMKGKQDGPVIFFANGCISAPAVEKVMINCPDSVIGIGFTTKVSQDRATLLLGVCDTLLNRV